MADCTLTEFSFQLNVIHLRIFGREKKDAAQREDSKNERKKKRKERKEGEKG